MNTFWAPETQFRWFTAGAVCLLGLLAYSNTMTGEFVWDDASSILLHKNVQDPAQLGQLFREDQHAFGRGQGNFYRPLLSVSFMIDFLLSHKGDSSSGIPDVSPFLFHVSNTAWHIGAALMLFALLTRVGAPRAVRLAVPLLYVVHPLHTEAVTYISGRGDPMCACLLFAGLWFSLLEGSPARRLVGVLCGVMCFTGSLLSKESGLIFPLLLIPMLLVAPARPADMAPRKALLGRLIPLLASPIALGIYWSLRNIGIGSKSDSGAAVVGWGERLTETGQALALYFRVMVVPTGLHMERTLEGVPSWLAGAGGVILLGLLALLAAGLYARRYRMASAIAWFLITWFPISGLIPLNAPMAEHWLYVPMAGLLWALFEIINPVFRHKGWRVSAWGLVCAACLFFAVLTVARNRDWHDNESLYKATLAENPKSIRVHYNLAVTYQDLLGNPAGARRHYEHVVELYRDKKAAAPAGEGAEIFWDDELESHLSLGDIYLQQGNIQQAANHYRVVLSIKPTQAKARLMGLAAFGMGRCFLVQGQKQEAQKLFGQAIKLVPELQSVVASMTGSGGAA